MTNWLRPPPAKYTMTARLPAQRGRPDVQLEHILAHKAVVPVNRNVCSIAREISELCRQFAPHRPVPDYSNLPGAWAPGGEPSDSRRRYPGRQGMPLKREHVAGE